MSCLDIASFVLEFTHSYKRRLSHKDLDCFTKSDVILAKYLATINHEYVYADEQTNMFASHEYSSLDHCSADCSLCACNICTCRTCFFSQEGLIMKPHRAKMGDTMLEVLMWAICITMVMVRLCLWTAYPFHDVGLTVLRVREIF